MDSSLIYWLLCCTLVSAQGTTPDYQTLSRPLIVLNSTVAKVKTRILRQVSDYASQDSESAVQSSEQFCWTHDYCFDSNEMCVTNRCRNPCRGFCGRGAICIVCKRKPVCKCPPGYVGDPIPKLGCKPHDPDPGLTKCLKNTDCKITEVCIKNQCEDPCDNSCGANADCTVIDRKPKCSCKPGFTGCPISGCSPITPMIPECKDDNDCSMENACVNGKCESPCTSDACGENTVCQVCEHLPICRCTPGFVGDPSKGKGCKPDTDNNSDPPCLKNSDCEMNKACIRYRCKDPCLGWCGINTHCQVIDYRPLCMCLPGFIGCPAYGCKPDKPVPPEPTCSIDNDCPSHLVCTSGKCKDPCVVGFCGKNAECKVNNHRPQCSCLPGHVGDPFTACYPAPEPTCSSDNDCPSHLVCTSGKCKDPCVVGFCGKNAECKVNNHRPQCSCLPGHVGDPFTACYPAPEPTCSSDNDCPSHLVCTSGKCKDPCVVGFCGKNAECKVNNHRPQCSCLPGHVGDPFTACYPAPEPSCSSDNDCPSHLVCTSGKCKDPCVVGFCGKNAECKVNNHRPQCSCLPGHVGDPFTACYPAPEPTCSSDNDCPSHLVCTSGKCKDPCVAGFCGKNAECKVNNHRPQCSCLPGHVGDPFTACYPVPGNQCKADSDCRPNQACRHGKCIDPCIDQCGSNTLCTVQNHIPACICKPGYIGDPLKGCNMIQIVCEENVQCPAEMVCQNGKCVNPCEEPDVCGTNALCMVKNHAPYCVCKPGFKGDPFVHCYPETPGVCSNDADCPSSLACINGKCVDPCSDHSCGSNANCQVVDHRPLCVCHPGFTGKPEVGCKPINEVPSCAVNTDCPVHLACINHMCVDPCCRDHCGYNTICTVRDHMAFCTCKPGHIGNPHEGCTRDPTVPSCTSSSDCPHDLSCVDHLCVNLCDNHWNGCGVNTYCRVQDNSPVCYCKPGFIGNPYIKCEADANGPSCTSNSQCPKTLSCVNGKCVDPCVDHCGPNTLCKVRNHTPVCACRPGFIGDPYVGCKKDPSLPSCASHSDCHPDLSCVDHVCINLCDERWNGCGVNTYCHVQDNSPVCYCKPGFIGNPYIKCDEDPNVPSCTSNSQCPKTLACVNDKCVDPCANQCGPNTQCTVHNHTPSCVCRPGFIGNPFVGCKKDPSLPPCQTDSQCGPDRACINNVCLDPCHNRCGPNTICKVYDHRPVCFCEPGFIGNPLTGCEEDPSVPKCSENHQCERDRVCAKGRCINPCPHQCGENTLCMVVNHTPLCACIPGYTGNPFSKCEPDDKLKNCSSNSQCEEKEACINDKCVDPCKNRCGPNTWCQVRNHNPFCGCLPGFIGDPITGCTPDDKVPSCSKPSDCPKASACINGKCVDPCVDHCGYNTVCKVHNHTPFCSCLPGYIGDPFEGCEPDPTVPSCITHLQCPEDRACINHKCVDPCQDHCGENTICKVRNHIPHCRCRSGYIGDPYSGCVPDDKVPSCENHFQCSRDRACINGKCVDPCQDQCGENTNCKVRNHTPFCSCKPGYIGYPIMGCVHDPTVANCTHHSDCPDGLSCYDHKCVNPCEGLCGANTRCRVLNHTPFCSCLPGHIGDPFEGCIPDKNNPGCRNHYDCPLDLACLSGRCDDPCRDYCGQFTMCRVRNHTPFCACLLGYKGNPLVMCVPDDTAPPCTTNEQCPPGLGCFSMRCVNPCRDHCGDNAECSVMNHTPHCLCRPGYTGDPFHGCTPIGVIPSECVVPDYCPVSPVTCLKCIPWFCMSKPNVPGVVPWGGCSSHEQCPDTQVCAQGRCTSPCPGACGDNSICKVTSHITSCGCKIGYFGDPILGCRPNCDLGVIGEKWPRGGTKRYQVETSFKSNWHGAFIYCLKNGRRLATVESLEEANQTREAIINTNIQNEEFWISGTKQSGVWTWMSTGSPIKFTDWNTGKPEQDSCISYSKLSDGNALYHWSDNVCTKSLYFICEYYE